MRDVVSSLSFTRICQLTKRKQPRCQYLPFKPSEMGDTYVHFIRHVTPTPRSESSELQNLRRNAAEGPRQKVNNVHGLTLWHGFKPRISINYNVMRHARL